MTQVAIKSKKLWGNPKVFMSATDLIVEERYYALGQTHGAYVEQAPEEAAKVQQPTADTQSGFNKTLTIIGAFFLIILIIVFVSWWYDGYNNYSSGGGSSKKYQLILVGDGGPVVVLIHQNVKKLKEIATQVNQTLVDRGISPQTGVYNSITPVV